MVAEGPDLKRFPDLSVFHCRFRAAFAVIGLSAVVSACTPAQPGQQFNDPYEDVNRQVHAFNKDMDRVFLRPAGQVVAIAPPGTFDPIVNFSDNASLPGMALNGFLQGNVDGALTNSVRFVINSTLGIGGFFDPAGAFGLREDKTDFGQTLAVWGVPEGAYVELPLIGPSTERDAFGEVMDMVLDPLDAVGLDAQIEHATAARVGEIIVERGEFGSTVDGLLYDSADSYAQARLTYLQNRRFELGETSDETQIDPYSVDPYAIDPYAIDPYEELDQ